MAYVDKEALLAEYDREHQGPPGKARKLIENAPAADVAPVVRGKWVNYGDEYRPDIRCCVCGQRKPILLGNFNFNFCSNCGADTREVDNA